MKLCWSLAIAIVGLSIISTTAKAESSDLWEEDDKEVLIRSIRGTKERTSGSTTTKASACRYTKGEWTECDTNLNIRTRVLTLKKGDKNNCEEKKTIRKKCKKACRYEKGTWSSCANHKTTRIDHLKSNSDPSCEKTRETTRNCKPETNTKKSTKGDRSNKKTGGKQ